MNKIFLKLKVLIKKSFFKYLIISVAFLIWMTFLDTNSLLIHAELNREIKKLKNKRNALNEEILKDRSLIEKLDNIDSLDKIVSSNIFEAKEYIKQINIASKKLQKGTFRETFVKKILCK